MVEIQEFQLSATDVSCHGQAVYKVTIYSNIKKGFFGNVKYDKYIFPFYFKSKKLLKTFWSILIIFISRMANIGTAEI